MGIFKNLFGQSDDDEDDWQDWEDAANGPAIPGDVDEDIRETVRKALEDKRRREQEAKEKEEGRNNN